MVDIFDEVEEDLRADRARAFAKRYGILIVALMVLVVAAVGGWQAWRWYDARQTMAQAGAYIAAMRTADGLGAGADKAQRDAAKDAFLAVAAGANDGYRTLARLRAAALAGDNGDQAGALTLLDQVSNDGAADPLLRDLASLLWVQRQVDGGDPAALGTRLAPLVSPGNPWHALAQETQALLALRAGRRDEARDIYKRLAGDLTAPESLRGRAAGLFARLGGGDAG